MPRLVLDPPQVAFVVATRAALAFGAGLLISERLSHSQRRSIGGTLVTIGALTTIPALLMLAQSRESGRVT